MPQLIAFALFGLAGWLLYRKFVRDAERLTERSRQEQREEENGSSGTLIEDPLTGEYRVRRDDE